MPMLTPHVPSGLIELMKDLAKEVLRDKPENIYEFALVHFEKLILERDGSLDKGYEQFTVFEAFFDGHQRFAVPSNSGYICQKPIKIQPIPQPRKSKSDIMASFQAMESINEEDVVLAPAPAAESPYADEKYQNAIYVIQRYFRRYTSRMKNPPPISSESNPSQTQSETLSAFTAAIIIQRTMRRLFSNKIKLKKDKADAVKLVQDDVDNVSEAASYTSSSTIQMLADGQEGKENRLASASEQREEVSDGDVDGDGVVGAADFSSIEFKEPTQDEEPPSSSSSAAAAIAAVPLVVAGSHSVEAAEVDRKSIADENGKTSTAISEENLNHPSASTTTDDTSTAHNIGILSTKIGSNYNHQNLSNTKTHSEIDRNTSRASEPTKINITKQQLLHIIPAGLNVPLNSPQSFSLSSSLGATPDTLPAASPNLEETQETFKVHRLQEYGNGNGNENENAIVKNNDASSHFQGDGRIRKYDSDTGESLKIYDVFYHQDMNDQEFSDSLNESTMEKDSLEPEELDADSLESNENVMHQHMSEIVKRDARQDDGSLYGDKNDDEEREQGEAGDDNDNAQNLQKFIEMERVPTYLYGIHPARTPVVERRNKSRNSEEAHKGPDGKKYLEVTGSGEVDSKTPDEKSEENSLESKGSTSEESSVTQIENNLLQQRETQNKSPGIADKLLTVQQENSSKSSLEIGSLNSESKAEKGSQNAMESSKNQEFDEPDTSDDSKQRNETKPSVPDETSKDPQHKNALQLISTNSNYSQSSNDGLKKPASHDAEENILPESESSEDQTKIQPHIENSSENLAGSESERIKAVDGSEILKNVETPVGRKKEINKNEEIHSETEKSSSNYRKTKQSCLDSKISDLLDPDQEIDSQLEELKNLNDLESDLDIEDIGSKRQLISETHKISQNDVDNNLEDFNQTKEMTTAIQTKNSEDSTIEESENLKEMRTSSEIKEDEKSELIEAINSKVSAVNSKVSDLSKEIKDTIEEAEGQMPVVDVLIKEDTHSEANSTSSQHDQIIPHSTDKCLDKKSEDTFSQAKELSNSTIEDSKTPPIDMLTSSNITNAKKTEFNNTVTSKISGLSDEIKETIEAAEREILKENVLMEEVTHSEESTRISSQHDETKPKPSDNTTEHTLGNTFKYSLKEENEDQNKASSSNSDSFKEMRADGFESENLADSKEFSTFPREDPKSVINKTKKSNEEQTDNMDSNASSGIGVNVSTEKEHNVVEESKTDEIRKESANEDQLSLEENTVKALKDKFKKEVAGINELENIDESKKLFSSEDLDASNMKECSEDKIDTINVDKTTDNQSSNEFTNNFDLKEDTTKSVDNASKIKEGTDNLKILKVSESMDKEKNLSLNSKEIQSNDQQINEIALEKNTSENIEDSIRNKKVESVSAGKMGSENLNEEKNEQLSSATDTQLLNNEKLLEEEVVKQIEKVELKKLTEEEIALELKAIKTDKTEHEAIKEEEKAIEELTKSLNATENKISTVTKYTVQKVSASNDNNPTEQSPLKKANQENSIPSASPEVLGCDGSSAETSADFSSIGKDLEFFEDTIKYLKNATEHLGEMDNVFDSKTNSVEASKDTNLLNNSAVLIQSAFRGYQVRRDLKELKELESKQPKEAEHSRKKRSLDTNETNFEFNDENHVNAAIKIQSSYRGHRVRKDLKEKLNKEERNNIPSSSNDDIPSPSKNILASNSPKSQIPVAVIHPTKYSNSTEEAQTGKVSPMRTTTSRPTASGNSTKPYQKTAKSSPNKSSLTRQKPLEKRSSVKTDTSDEKRNESSVPHKRSIGRNEQTLDETIKMDKTLILGNRKLINNVNKPKNFRSKTQSASEDQHERPRGSKNVREQFERKGKSFSMNGRVQSQETFDVETIKKELLSNTITSPPKSGSNKKKTARIKSGKQKVLKSNPRELKLLRNPQVK